MVHGGGSVASGHQRRRFDDDNPCAGGEAPLSFGWADNAAGYVSVKHLAIKEVR